MSVEGLAPFLSSLDTPTKAIVGVLCFLGIFAFRFFPERTPVPARLFVFAVMAGLGGGAMLLLHQSALRAAPGARPAPAADAAPPSAAPADTSWFLLLGEGVAHAQSNSGWAYIGRFDEASQRWLEGPDLQGLAGRLPKLGDLLTVSRDLDLYGDQPRFSAFSGQWQLGTKSGTLRAGRRASVDGAALLVGQNVWVRVSEARS